MKRLIGILALLLCLAIPAMAAEGSFVGTCHAGVKEFVYPITDCGTPRGFVSVSGYKDPQGDSYLQRVAQKYAVPYGQLKDIYDTLESDLPQKQWVDSLINPLVRMLELAYLNAQNNPEREMTCTD